MKKILLVCCAGMSTSLLVNRMREVAKTKEIDCKIWSTSEKELPNEFAQEPADVILVGPQIRYLLNNIKKEDETSANIKVKKTFTNGAADKKFNFVLTPINNAPMIRIMTKYL